MAGHSKWKNIRHRKNAQDAQRGKIFTKLIREITVSAKMGGEDPNANPRLRTAIDKALRQNMTRDTISRAIKRGIGGDEDSHLEEIRYEGYGPGGVAVLVDCLSDNRNRTVSDVRHAFTKAGGNLGTDGSVAYLFQKKGVLSFAAGADENRIMEAALEAGADDVQTSEDGTVDVYTTPESFESVKTAIEAKKLTPEQAEVTVLATLEVDVDMETAEKLLRMIDTLEDLDDVQNVYTNAKISPDIMKQLGS